MPISQRLIPASTSATYEFKVQSPPQLVLGIRSERLARGLALINACAPHLVRAPADTGFSCVWHLREILVSGAYAYQNGGEYVGSCSHGRDLRDFNFVCRRVRGRRQHFSRRMALQPGLNGDNPAARDPSAVGQHMCGSVRFPRFGMRAAPAVVATNMEMKLARLIGAHQFQFRFISRYRAMAVITGQA